MLAWPYAATTVVLLGIWGVRLEQPIAQALDLATFWATLPAVALLVVAALARDGRAVVLFALPAVTCIWAYGGAFLPSSPPEVDPDLRVVAFNTFVGVTGSDHVLGVIDEHDPDVVLLQEVFGDREAELTAALGDRYPHVRFDRSDGVGAVAVLSRHPITSVTPVGGASDRSRGTSIVTLDVAGRAIQVSSVHLISPCPTCGPSLLERIELEDHVRSAEVSAVLAALDPEVPAIVGGDLNSNDRGTAYRRLVGEGFDDAQRDAGRGMGFTWPADGRVPPFVRLDWIMTRGVTVASASVGDGRGSDHRPVVVDVAFDTEEP
jgi:endonuclease/exonuclease/phosphatase (EEP) superfamily protein YafD